jgi:hypothetical protein
MITQDKLGSRTVTLFIPFDYNGRKIETITFSALRFGHVLLWGQGNWDSMVGLMAELANVDEALIREVRFPDADRILEAFMAQLTAEMRNDITEGRIPVKAEDDEQPAPPTFPVEEYREPEATNGSGQPIGPGVPLPEQPQAGFDLSEEP